jgi:hypothetical protein
MVWLWPGYGLVMAGFVGGGLPSPSWRCSSLGALVVQVDGSAVAGGAKERGCVELVGRTSRGRWYLPGTHRLCWARRSRGRPPIRRMPRRMFLRSGAAHVVAPCAARIGRRARNPPTSCCWRPRRGSGSAPRSTWSRSIARPASPQPPSGWCSCRRRCKPWRQGTTPRLAWLSLFRGEGGRSVATSGCRNALNRWGPRRSCPTAVHAVAGAGFLHPPAISMPPTDANSEDNGFALLCRP